MQDESIIPPWRVARDGYLKNGYLPIPFKPRTKFPPPSGVPNEITNLRELKAAWRGYPPNSNIGTIVPDGVIVVDIDGPAGWTLQEQWEVNYGLPPTWEVETREGKRHRYYRVPGGLAWPGKLPGGGGEFRHRHNSYVVLPPSIHPKTGLPYRWITPDGEYAEFGLFPSPEELPDFPNDLVTDITNRKGYEHVKRDSNIKVKEWIIEHGDGDLCERIDVATRTRKRQFADRIGGGEGLHPVASEAQRELVGLINEGHPGGLAAFKKLRMAFLDAAVDSGRDHGQAVNEWVRARDGAIQKYGSEAPADDDPCDMDIILASDIEETKLTWLWAGMIPDGKLTVLDGDPGKGKTLITLDIAARVSTGTPMPLSRKKRRARGVVVLCSEDDWSDTVIPRLRLAAADLTKIAHVPMETDAKGMPKPMELPRDLRRIKAAINKVNARLVIVDPIMGFMGEGVNTNNDASVRRALTPLKELASQTGTAFLLVRHLTKDGEAQAIYRGGGSIAFIGVARSGLVAELHPEEPGYVLAQVKHNLNKAGASYIYDIVEVEDETEYPRVSWRETSTLTADQILKPDSRTVAPVRSECETYILDLLQEQHPYPAKDIMETLRDEGFTPKIVYAAKRKLNIASERERTGNREWYWKFRHPEHPDES